MGLFVKARRVGKTLGFEVCDSDPPCPHEGDARAHRAYTWTTEDPDTELAEIVREIARQEAALMKARDQGVALPQEGQAI